MNVPVRRTLDILFDYLSAIRLDVFEERLIFQLSVGKSAVVKFYTPSFKGQPLVGGVVPCHLEPR